MKYLKKPQEDAALPVQAKRSNGGVQLNDHRQSSVLQQKQVAALSNKQANETAQKKANTTGLPDQLKSGIENLSGHSMDDVKVHYNSSQPAQLNAHAYAQGSQIHIASGQEKHLPHEAWHVVQQKQGRVKPTMQMKGKVNVNDDKGLEKEADAMGARASAVKYNPMADKAFRVDRSGSDHAAQLTPAEDLLRENKGHPEDNMHALIGTDNKYSSLIKPELAYCMSHNMTLPATLASHLVKSGKPWSKDENTAWIKEMVASSRVFVVLHTKIEQALHAGKFDSAYAAQPKPIGDTWIEVKHLLDTGYVFEPESGVLLPKGLAAAEYKEIMDHRIAENKGR